jgi:FixJ family two-component response regulator
MLSSVDVVNPLGHVVVIDDDVSVRRSLCTMLERAGYRVSDYENADAFLQNPVLPLPAVLLLDMRMPGTTGVMLQAKLKALVSYPVPIVFVSGDSRPDEIISAMKQGAVDFLLKPFTAQAMLDVITRAMQLAIQSQETSSKHAVIQARLQRLTPRELEICYWMVRGFSNQQISSFDGGAAATIKLHRSRVMEKMQVDSLPALIDMVSGLSLPQPVRQAGTIV